MSEQIVGQRKYRSLYRAKRLVKDRFGDPWIYGAYVSYEQVNYCFAEEEPEDNLKHFIYHVSQGDWNMNNEIEPIEIDPNTIRQCTACFDKNNKLIFEGDTLLVGDRHLRVVWDGNTASFMLKLWLSEENRVSYVPFDATFVRQFERIEEEL